MKYNVRICIFIQLQLFTYTMQAGVSYCLSTFILEYKPWNNECKFLKEKKII